MYCTHVCFSLMYKDHYCNYPNHYCNYPNHYCNYPNPYCKCPNHYCNYLNHYCNYPSHYCNYPNHYCKYLNHYCNYSNYYWFHLLLDSLSEFSELSLDFDDSLFNDLISFLLQWGQYSISQENLWSGNYVWIFILLDGLQLVKSRWNYSNDKRKRWFSVLNPIF